MDVQSINLLSFFIELQPVGRFQRSSLQVQVEPELSRISIFGVTEGISWDQVAEGFTGSDWDLSQSLLLSRWCVANLVDSSLSCCSSC